MRLAIITGEYPPMEGGVGDFTHELSLALAAQGHEIHILTNLDEAQPVERSEGLIIHRKISDWGWASHSQLTRCLRDVDPDIINIQYQAAAYEMRAGIDLFPRWQGRNLQAPIVTTFHDLLPPYLFPKAGPLRRWAVWQLAQYSDGVIVTNGGDYTMLNQNLKEEHKPTLRLIHIGSNIAPNPPEDFNRQIWRYQNQLQDSDLLLGFFGFLNRSKGIESLLDALAALRQQDVPAHLVFIGGRTGSSDLTNAAYAREIDTRIKELELDAHVLRTGFTEPPEVSAALLASDICALPYRDGASLRRGTLHACLAHGNAIVTTEPTTDVPQLQAGENVMLVPRGNAEALVDAILEVWHNPGLRVNLGRNAKALATEFSWDRIAAHTAELFRRIVQQRQAQHQKPHI